ncbi:unnamed protein product, partial [Tetraodon nigroviridis]
VDANECEVSICIHAHSCHNLIGGYLCDCLPGWVGPNCDIRNSSCQDLCQNNGHCEVTGSARGAVLPSWFDRCLSVCFLPLVLKDLVSGSRCVCPPGFSGTYCQNAPRPCEGAPCLHGGQCVETAGTSATCICPAGYSGNLCERALDLCDPNPCQQGSSCHSSEGRYVCVCL